MTEEEIEREALRLIAEGYLSTSSKYRHLGRLPEGKTGFEALEVADPYTAKRMRESFERMCTGQYLRVYAQHEPEKITVSDEVFRCFKKLGGQVA